MDYCKDQIENLSASVNDLTKDFFEMELDLYASVKKLMSIIWSFLFEIVKAWEKQIRIYQKEIQNCPECLNKLYTVKRTFPELIFPFGRIKFFHRKVRCSKCGYRDGLLKWWIPQGLKYRITPILGEKLVWLCAMLPYREVQYYLKSFWDLDLSIRGIQNYVRTVGERIIQQSDLLNGEMVLTDAKWDKVYIYVDGVMVFINNRWCEVKVGIIECIKGNRKYYYYHSEKVHWKTFLKNMKRISQKLGCDKAKVRLFISDAGKGITANIGSYFQGYRFLIDYYHACEHISVFIKSLGEKRKVVQKDLRNQLTSLLYKGQIKELVRRMENICCGKKNKILQREIAYFKKHELNFDFATFRKHKWNIGSGNIESACRWLIQQRFKLSGQRWKLPGFNLILNLRLAFYNQRMFPAFEKVIEKEVA